MYRKCVRSVGASFIGLFLLALTGTIAPDQKSFDGPIEAGPYHVSNYAAVCVLEAGTQTQALTCLK